MAEGKPFLLVDQVNNINVRLPVTAYSYQLGNMCYMPCGYSSLVLSCEMDFCDTDIYIQYRNIFNMYTHIRL